MNHPSPDTTVPIIRPLPIGVINKIAAGEVVERPASVVKELVENAIDSGAGRIDIIIEKSGTKLIKIVDNGFGIDEQQIEIAFSRHATSKISSFDDLNQLLSYGFRGEALPSIASVSRLRMVSRTATAASGTEIIFEGGVLHSKEPVAAPPGTVVEVENLFYNTPARRKFLKTETTEARHISRLATALAIGRCDIGFSLTMNNRNLFALTAGTSLTERVSELLGNNETFLTVSGSAGPVAVSGCVAAPDLAQNNRYGQFIFVNGRFIHSPTLSHALAAGYGELLPRGQFPVGALLLTVDPSEIDVNVHPAKTEVRLSRDREIHDAICRIIQQTLRNAATIPTFQTDKSAPLPPRAEAAAPDTPDRTCQSSGLIPGVQPRQEFNRTAFEELCRTSTGRTDNDDLTARVDKETGEVLATDQEPASRSAPAANLPEGLRLVGCFAELYLLVQWADDLYIIDQHTAHERVLYEEMLPLVERQGVSGQNLLFPVQVELTPEQWSIFEEAGDLLDGSGFTANAFGGRTVNIEAIPAILSRKPPEKTFRQIIDDLASLKKGGHDLKKAIAQSLACRAAVMAGDRLNDDEAVVLVSRLMACRDRYSCPHGRPTFVKITRHDLDRQFKRA
ncbi:MAG: DNA mismatch repair endonuclease MutL [bacterium]